MECVVNDELCLADDKEDGHMAEPKLIELELVVSLFQVEHEQYKTYRRGLRRKSQ